MDNQTILVIILVIAVIAFRVLPNLVAKSKGDSQHGSDYGAFGGVVYPNCTLPYGLTMGKINLGIGALSRCPHCGKWRVVRRASPEALAAAEERLGGEASPTNEKVQIDEEEKLRRELDDSRFEE